MAKIKTNKKNLTTDGKEQLGFSYFNGGSVNWYIHLENYLAVSTKTVPKIPKKTEDINALRGMYKTFTTTLFLTENNANIHQQKSE